MSRNSRRALATAVAGVFALAPLVTACAAGQHPQSVLPTRLAEGVNASAHQLDVRNAFVLGPAPGKKLTAGADAALYAWFVNNATSPDRLIAAEAPGVAQSVQIAGGAVALPPNTLINTVETPGSVPTPPAATATPNPATTPTGTPGTVKPGAGKNGKNPGTAKAPGTTGTPPRQPLTPGTGATQGAPPPPAPTPSSKLILKGLAKDYSGGETLKVTLHFQQAGTLTLSLPVVPWNGYYSTYSPAPAVPAPPAAPLPGQPGTQPGTPPSTQPTAGTSPAGKSKARVRAKKKKAPVTPAV